MTDGQFLHILKRELAPAVGCTEPVAIAYAAARARAELGRIPDRATVKVSRNILKNAMGVGIPGTDQVGLSMAAAMGIMGGDSDAILEVLRSVTKEQTARAREYAPSIQVSLADTDKKLYIEVLLRTEDDFSLVVIEDSHTNITKIQHGDKVVYDQSRCEELPNGSCREDSLTVEGIYRFVCRVDWRELRFLDECVRMNWAIAQESLHGSYGLAVGKSIYEGMETGGQITDEAAYGVALACAAADARMSGSTLPVMTVCGSGNQGITATLPVIGAVIARREDTERLYRALALSCLVTIHVKQFIGKLSPLCGCGMGSSIGVCCALVYLGGGGLKQIKNAVNNMIACVSGIICDGAKPGCALKISSVVSSAFQCAMLALRDHAAGELDGIVSLDVEHTIQNLGELGNRGMACADQVILDMMVEK